MRETRPDFERALSILLVDESPDRGSTAELLRATPASVRVVADFQGALEALGPQVPDVLITECRLREYNGLHLIMRLRALDPTAVAIVLTAHPDPVLEEEARRLGATYLTKPCVSATLCRVMTDGLVGRYAGACSDLGLPRSAHPSWDLDRLRPAVGPRGGPLRAGRGD